MFDDLNRRAGEAAERRARWHSARLAERMADELPKDVSAAAGRDGIWIKGRGLRRRLALDAALRWLTERVR